MDLYTRVNNLLLIIQPGDSFFPLVDAIDGASQSIKMTIFRMDDPVVRDALTYAVGRGVRVQALVAPSSKGWTRRNRKLTDELTALGVEVRSPRAKKKERVRRFHYKMMTVDDRLSLILTFNPTRKNLHYARDLGVLVKDGSITSELNRLFDADWNGEEFQPESGPLAISPHNSRRKLRELLESAERSIRIMDAKLRDDEMIDIIERKATAGCSVKIISAQTDMLDGETGLEVWGLERYKLHAKCVVVDSSRFFIGSQNLRTVSLDRRREVGILIEDEAMARRIERVFEDDWLTATEMRAAVEAGLADPGD